MILDKALPYLVLLHQVLKTYVLRCQLLQCIGATVAVVAVHGRGGQGGGRIATSYVAGRTALWRRLKAFSKWNLFTTRLQ